MNDYASQFDRLPPHSIVDEQCMLASMMLDKEMLTRCAAIVVARDALFQADHQIIFDVVVEMNRKGKPIDAVILCGELDRRHLLEEIGGKAYVGQILNTVPSAAHGEHYARMVAEKHKLRSLIALSNDMLRKAYAPASDDNANDLAADCARRAESIIDHGSEDTIRSAAQVADHMLEEKTAGVRSRMDTGLPDLDEIAGGFPIGGYTIIAADGGIGKSQLCKQIVRNSASLGISCGIVAAEESAEKIISNYLAGLSGIENSKIIRNALSAEDWPRIWQVVPELQKLPIFIDDAQRKLSRVESCIRRMVKKYGCRLVVVDHLHLLDGETTQNRTQEVDKISKALKATFKELKIVGIVAAQVNRSGNPSDPPTLSQLRDSGSLVADGDVILQLRRMDWFRWKDDPNFQPDHKLEVFVNKNKDGPMGMREFYFDGDHQTISDWNNGRGPNEIEDPF